MELRKINQPEYRRPETEILGGVILKILQALKKGVFICQLPGKNRERNGVTKQ